MPADTPATREQLLDAGERLVREHGPNVSARAIVSAAGQRNQSALAYHFGGRDGLVDAIVQRRLDQVEARRAALLEQGTPDDLRGACALLIRAIVELAAEDSSFRDTFGAFGVRLILSDDPLGATQPAGAATDTLHAAIHGALSALPEDVRTLRIDHANGLALLAICRRARADGAFRGADADLFLNTLVDEVAAVLAAPLSAATRAAHGDPR